MKMRSLLLVALTALLFCGCGEKKPKVLTVYYSLSGNTRAVAEQVQARFGGDIYEIELAAPYPTDEADAVAQVQKEMETPGFRPQLKGGVEKFADYDVVFIGSPIWFNTAASPVFAFAEAHDFTGKTVIPFYTCGGGGEGTYVEDMKAACKGAAFKTSFGNTRAERQEGVATDKINTALDRIEL